MAVPLSVLKKRRDFLRVQASPVKVVTKGLILCADVQDASVQSRVGYTVTKNVGNSVERNRVRRRLRALVQSVMPPFLDMPADFVLIGRKATLEREFTSLEKDLKYALHTFKKNARQAA